MSIRWGCYFDWSCRYEGQEDQCPNNCKTCILFTKRTADDALASGDVEQAIRFYRQTVFASPEKADIWVALGKAYHAKSEPGNAVHSFDKALLVENNNKEAMLGKAISFQALGRLEESMEISNNILELYDDCPEVVELKRQLVATGVEDTYYIIENKNFINELENRGYDVAEENHLLDGKEFYDAIYDCGDVYYPDDFIEPLLEYCRRKYKAFGEEKILDEAIVTSFYAAICVAVYYSEDESVFDEISQFEYLQSHIDLEFIDTTAEHLLNTKEGEEKADCIWGIISGYVKFARELFKSATNLTDDVVLCAMKNAYEIGLLTAFYYINGIYKKYMLDTKEQPEVPLLNFTSSSKDCRSPLPQTATCHSERVPNKILIQYTCDKCGRLATHEVIAGNKNIISKYRAMTNEFLKLGYRAEFSCYCNACAEHSTIELFASTYTATNNFVFSFWAKNDHLPKKSYPDTQRFTDLKYRVALAFLRGANSVTEIAAVTETNLDADNYIKYVKDVVGECGILE